MKSDLLHIKCCSADCYFLSAACHLAQIYLAPQVTESTSLLFTFESGGALEEKLLSQIRPMLPTPCGGPD